MAVADGLIAGPRLHISTAILSQSGGHADGWLPSGYDATPLSWPGMPSGVVDGPDEMRRAARQIIRAGADQIKVCTSGGVLSPRDDPRHGHFRDVELDVLVEEATAAGIPVMAHAQGAPGIKSAIRAGIRSIEHGIFLDDEAIEMMLQRGTWLVPTLVAPQGVLDAAAAGAEIPPASLRKAREVIGTNFNTGLRVRPIGFSRNEKLEGIERTQRGELALPERLALKDERGLVAAHARGASAREQDGAEWIVD